MTTENSNNYGHARYMEVGGIQLLARDAGAFFVGMGVIFATFDLIIDQTIDLKNLVGIGVGTILFKTGNHFIDRQNNVDDI